MSHTPGPWFVVERRRQEWDIDCKEEPRLGYTHWDGLATVYGCDDDPQNGREVGKANARLIAAAPDLLEALEDLVSEGRNIDYLPDGFWDMAKAAIAKARSTD